MTERMTDEEIEAYAAGIKREAVQAGDCVVEWLIRNTRTPLIGIVAIQYVRAVLLHQCDHMMPEEDRRDLEACAAGFVPVVRCQAHRK